MLHSRHVTSTGHLLPRGIACQISAPSKSGDRITVPNATTRYGNPIFRVSSQTPSSAQLIAKEYRLLPLRNWSFYRARFRSPAQSFSEKRVENGRGSDRHGGVEGAGPISSHRQHLSHYEEVSPRQRQDCQRRQGNCAGMLPVCSCPTSPRMDYKSMTQRATKKTS